MTDPARFAGLRAPVRKQRIPIALYFAALGFAAPFLALWLRAQFAPLPSTETDAPHVDAPESVEFHRSYSHAWAHPSQPEPKRGVVR